jgi:hypothetical protein
MRFATKFDTWLVVCLVAGLGGSLVPALRGIPSHWVLAPIGLIWGYLLLATLPQYYEVRPEGLFIRQGILTKVLIPYEELTEVRASSDSRSAGVYSTDRVMVATKKPKTYVIAPVEQDRFFEEVARRAPQLERRAGGLALPFAMFTNL